MEVSTHFPFCILFTLLVLYLARMKKSALFVNLYLWKPVWEMFEAALRLTSALMAAVVPCLFSTPRQNPAV